MSWNELYDLCESPSERAFLTGLAAICGPISDRDVVSLLADEKGFKRWTYIDDFGLYVQPEDEWGRADFAITVTGALDLYIEIDGHAFHERTKEQAARDRRKDRARLIAGAPTVRFTGSEVFHDPAGCARESLDALDAVLLRQEEAVDIYRAHTEIRCA